MKKFLFSLVFLIFSFPLFALPRGKLIKGRALNPRPTPFLVGALKGKRIVISPGHGYFNKPGYWTTQRGVTHGLIEDIHTNEIVIDFLIPYLVRSGAQVISCRERSYQIHEVIVDNRDAGYREFGRWRESPARGFRHSYRYTLTSRWGGKKARFTPNIPEDGYYPVYLYYRAGRNRTKEALVRVVHSGGTTLLTVDQTRDGNVWRFVGEFYFLKGKKGYVEIENKSSEEGKVVVADAVRFGGGRGKSGRARWKEGAKAWITYAGALLPYGEVNIRGRYADWRGGDAYISIHTNAGGGQGTSSFIHSYAPSPGSAAFRAKIHDQLIRDIRKTVGTWWKDRGKKKANFGELRNTRTMPAVLLELAFHDHKGDARLLKEQRFRHLLARAIYKGVLKYFAPGVPPSPLPPHHFWVRHTGPSEVTLGWKEQQDPLEPRARAEYYIVYTSQNGFGFDNGVKVKGRRYTFRKVTPGALYFFRVTAVNRGGESLPSETLAVRIPRGRQKGGILIVSGFDRMKLYSTYKRRDFNERNYVVYHAFALAKNGYFFDSASNEAVESGELSLSSYQIVDWILGKESTEDETFSKKEQRLLRKYLKKGGALFVSGSEIAWDLDKKGDAEDRKFFHKWLLSGFVADSARVSRVKGMGFFSSLEFSFGEAWLYPVDYPDVVFPKGQAKVCFRYPDGRGAGICYRGKYKLVYLAFPFESVHPERKRVQLMERIYDFLR